MPAWSVPWHAVTHRPAQHAVAARAYSTDDKHRAHGLSHVSEDGRTPQMVDVSGKTPTRRTAHARAFVDLPAAVVAALRAGPESGRGFALQGARGSEDIVGPKGPVFATAVVAGTMGAKRTSDLVPFCHPLALEDCKIAVRLVDGAGGAAAVQIDCVVVVHGKTGVEMEALTGASVCALTVYDMCKALSHEMVVREVRLLRKTGGKTDLSYDGRAERAEERGDEE